jgi:hypothetical protein
LEGKWSASKNGGWEGGFGGVCKIEACLEALLEMDFYTKPPNFGVEAHMKAPAGDALTVVKEVASIFDMSSAHHTPYVDLYPSPL